MLYTPATKLALRICFDAHRDQVDKSGLPYVFHPFHLAEQMDTEHEVFVALLHDVLEDTPLTAEDLLAAGVPAPYVATCRLMTHVEGVAYLDYVAALSADPVARKVKLADLRHNSDVTRLDHAPTGRDEQRIAKYAEAIELLERVERGEPVPGRGLADGGGGLLARFEGCLLGGAIGDALGYPVEFMSADSLRSEHGPAGIRSFEHIRPGEPALISDDTQMTLFTAVGILLADTWRNEYGTAIPIEGCVRLAYLDWLSTQDGSFGGPGVSWLLGIEGLYDLRAPGNTCMTTLYAGGLGTLESPANRSKGCGGVMRVAPWGLVRRDPADVRSFVRTGAALAAITHGHPLGWLPAAALCYIVNRCAFDVPDGCGDPRGALAGIVSDCAAGLPVWFPEEPEAADAMAASLQAAFELALEPGEGSGDDLSRIERLGAGWVGDEALAIAVYAALRHADDFDGALAAAVNHGGDSDSTGAICGNILGALLGIGAIGPQWRDVELRDVLLEVAHDLYTDCQGLGPAVCGDPDWQRKYAPQGATGQGR